MPIPLTCRCGVLYHLKDEYAGVLVQCPACSFTVQAGFPLLPTLRHPTAARRQSFADRLAGQHHFVVRSSVQADQPAAVYDATDKPILFVDGLGQLSRTRLARLASVIASLALVLLGILLAAQAGALLQSAAIAVLGLGAAATARASLPGLLSAPARLGFYADAERQQHVLELLPEGRRSLPRTSYRLQDAQGQPLALLQSSLLAVLSGTLWTCYTPDGSLLCLAVAEPSGQALRRRLLPLLGRQPGAIALLGAEAQDLLGALLRDPARPQAATLELAPEHAELLDPRIAIAIALLSEAGRP